MKNFSTLMISLFFILASNCSSPGRNSNNTSKSPRQKSILLIDSASAAMAENDPIGALQSLQAAQDTDPDFAPIYHAKALAFLMRKDLPQALKEMAHAHGLDSQSPSINNTYGKMLFDAGRIDEAQPLLEKAAENSTFREAYKARTTLGMIFYRQNRLEDALTQFDKAINDNSNLACIAHYYKGHILIRKKLLDDALGSYAKSCAGQCAGFVEGQLAYALALSKAGRDEEARKRLLDITQSFPDTEPAKSAEAKLKSMP